MKQVTYVNAYNTIGRISNQAIPLGTGLKLFNLKRQLQAQYDFQVESENKIFDRFPPQKAVQASNGKSILSFETPEAAAEAQKLLKELEEMEVNLEIIPIMISESDGLTLTINDIDALSPFVEFVTEEDTNTEPVE